MQLTVLSHNEKRNRDKTKDLVWCRELGKHDLGYLVWNENIIHYLSWDYQNIIVPIKVFLQHNAKEVKS